MECTKTYHIECINISEKLFYLMKEKEKWTCKICKGRLNTQKNISTPLTPLSKPPKLGDTSTSPNFVTQRTKYKINVSTENSFESLKSEDSVVDDNSHIETSILNRSCPERDYFVREDIDQLKIKITNLETKLLSAENEIENLLLENNTLRKKITNFEKKTEKLTHICMSTPARVKNQKHKRSLSKTKLDFTCTEKSEDTYINQTMPSNEGANSRHSTNNEATVIKDLAASSAGSSNINKKKDSLHRKVVLLSDQNGKGLSKVLQDVLGANYRVLGIVKPYAPIEEILVSSKSVCKNLTKSDYVVVLAGENDHNPLSYKSFLYCYLSALSHTNVLVCEIGGNKYVNVDKQNNILRLICSQFSHTTFVPQQRIYNNLSFYNHRLNICRLMLKEMLAIDYKTNYLNYVQKKCDYLMGDVNKKNNTKYYTIPYLFNKIMEKKKMTNANDSTKPSIPSPERLFREPKKNE